MGSRIWKKIAGWKFARIGTGEETLGVVWEGGLNIWKLEA